MHVPDPAEEITHLRLMMNEDTRTLPRSSGFHPRKKSDSARSFLFFLVGEAHEGRNLCRDFACPETKTWVISQKWKPKEAPCRAATILITMIL